MEGHVLVKNAKDALPLRKPKILSLFGYDGHAQLVNYPGSNPLHAFGWNSGLQNVNVSIDQLLSAILKGTSVMLESATEGTAFTGFGSGAGTPAYISDVSKGL